MRKPVSVFLGVFSIGLLLSCAVVYYFEAAPLGNVLGLLSIFCYSLTLFPSIIKIAFSRTKSHPWMRWLLKNRRYTGVAAFCFGVDHGVLIMIGNRSNIVSWQDYSQYLQGFILLGILTILAGTSNDSSVRYLKRNWKKIHQVTYIVPVLLLWHLITKMSVWTGITPVAIGLTSLLIIGLSLRMTIQFRKSHLV